MYNGRQNIQTESIHDPLVQNDPNMETKIERKMLQEQNLPAMKTQNTWQKEKYTRSSMAPI